MTKINPINHLEIGMMLEQIETAWLLTASKRLLKRFVQTRTNRMNDKLSFLVVDSFQVAFQNIGLIYQFKQGQIV